MVFCGLFPTEADRFPDLREALGKLQLNDAALVYEPEVRSLLLPSWGYRYAARLAALLCDVPSRLSRAPPSSYPSITVKEATMHVH